MKLLATVFGTVFLAELGDKTQLATLLLSTRESASLATIFVGASFALMLATGIAVVSDSLISQYVDPKYLSYAAGLGFVLIGTWTIWQA